MGTHPIFESDFDCLTESINRKCFSVDGAEWHKNQYYEVEYIFIQLDHSHMLYNTEKTKILFSIQLLISKKILGYQKKKLNCLKLLRHQVFEKSFNWKLLANWKILKAQSRLTQMTLWQKQCRRFYLKETLKI